MPPGPKNINMVKLPMWRYIGGLSITTDGTSQTVPVPSTATTFIISAETGAIYFAINHVGFANATSPSYVPADSEIVRGPIENLQTLDINGALNNVAHIEFYEEVAR